MATLRTLGYTAKSKKRIYLGGDSKRYVDADISIAAADDDDDVVILAYNLPVDTLVSDIKAIETYAAQTNGASDIDIGFYKPDDLDVGTVLDADILVDGLDLTSEVVGGSILIETSRTDTIGELLDLTVEDQPAGVHLVATINTAGTAASAIGLEISMICAG